MMKDTLGKISCVLLGGIIVAILFMLFGGFGFGLGTGEGDGGSGNSNTDGGSVIRNTDPSTEAYEEESEEKKAESERSDEKSIPDTIIVRIEENRVMINDVEVTDPEELKKKINEYNNDSRTFELSEDHAILSTYEWVKETFDELEIFLVEEDV